MFQMGDWQERGFWGRLFRKELQFTESEIQKNTKNKLKWIKLNQLGVPRPSSGSKLRSKCNGMPPGPQNGSTKFKKRQKGQKSRKSGIPRIFLYFPIGPKRARCGVGGMGAALSITYFQRVTCRVASSVRLALASHGLGMARLPTARCGCSTVLHSTKLYGTTETQSSTINPSGCG